MSPQTSAFVSLKKKKRFVASKIRQVSNFGFYHGAAHSSTIYISFFCEEDVGGAGGGRAYCCLFLLFAEQTGHVFVVHV